MARNYSSVAEPKTLTTDVGSSDVQITLNNVTGLPSAPYVLILNPDTDKEEAVLVTVDQTGVTSPTLKVQRAIEASGGFGGAQTHSVGNVVKHMIVGSDLQIVHDHFSNDNTTTGTAHGATGGVVGRTNSQTLTNKTVNLADNTLTGTKAQFNAALSDADFATLAGSEELTNKTLTSPTITGTITGAVITSANIVDGTITSTDIADGTIVNADISASAAIAQSKIANLTTDLAGKQATITGAATTIDTENLTASRALVSDASGKVAVSAVLATEVGHLDGVTSAIQTQLNNRLETSRTGAKVFIQTSQPTSGFSTYDIWIDY
jgi:hypothetical protein